MNAEDWDIDINRITRGVAMSEKQGAVTVAAEYEGTEQPVSVTLAVDYLNPGYVYLTLGEGEPVAIPTPEAKKLGLFINYEVY